MKEGGSEDSHRGRKAYAQEGSVMGLNGGGSTSFSYDCGGALAKNRVDLFAIPSTSEISIVEGAEGKARHFSGVSHLTCRGNAIGSGKTEAASIFEAEHLKLMDTSAAQPIMDWITNNGIGQHPPSGVVGRQKPLDLRGRILDGT
jgi:hypothetical protein